MAKNAAEIANLALARIGEKAFLDELDPDGESEEPQEDSAVAAVCRAVFANTRDALLAEWPWPFATKRVDLPALAGVSREDWAYAFNLPADFIQAQDIWPGTRNPSVAQRIPFAVELNEAGDGMLLLADVEEPTLKYTARITTVPLYHPLFVQALAWALAKELLLAIPVKPQLAPMVHQQAALALGLAKAAAMNGMNADEPPESELTSIRR